DPAPPPSRSRARGCSPGSGAAGHDRDVDEAFFLPTDDPDRFGSTRNTVGPWAAGLQHAGPPSALVARAVERLPSTVDGPAQVARLTVEILGAVPVADLTVRAQV